MANDAVMAFTFWALLCLVVGVIAAVRSPHHDARNEAVALGGGDESLGRRIRECDQRLEVLNRETRVLRDRLAAVSSARRKLAESRFADRAELFARAETLLQRQLDARWAVIEEWQRLARDLDALVAAHKAEAALGGLDLTGDIGALDEERQRLQAAADELMALDQVELELSGLR